MSDVANAMDKDKDKIIAGLLARLDELEKGVKRLNEELVRKNSRNSSVPPSTEMAPPKRTSSLRRASGKKPGGQPGHRGGNLKVAAAPDAIDRRIPCYCNACGADLSGSPVELVGKRQLIDIPRIEARVTEQQVYKRTCTCGHVTSGAFSGNANAPVGYGENLEGLTAYLHARQYLPVDRMKEMFSDVFGIPVSTGGICHILERFARKAAPVHRSIKERLASRGCVGADGTGCKVNGKPHWFWTWQAPGLTYIVHSPNRGKDTVDGNFPDGFPRSALVHDAWRPHLNTAARTHQLCTAHLARELNYLVELHGDGCWAKAFSGLLQSALELRRKMEGGPCCAGHERERHRIMDAFGSLLEKPPDKAHKKELALFKRVLKYKGYIFTFLFDLDVPPDNNASERAIRNIKVKQKVSGQFKAESSAMDFAIIRSVVDTALKNSRNVIGALKTIARAEPTALTV